MQKGERDLGQVVVVVRRVGEVVVGVVIVGVERGEVGRGVRRVVLLELWGLVVLLHLGWQGLRCFSCCVLLGFLLLRLCLLVGACFLVLALVLVRLPTRVIPLVLVDGRFALVVVVAEGAFVVALHLSADPVDPVGLEPFSSMISILHEKQT